jgi:tetratricopeptide (TPR) repeat protein
MTRQFGRVFAGRFQLDERLSVGSLGEMWAARRVNLGKRVVVRILTGEWTESAIRVKDLNERVRKLAGLQSSAIAAVVEQGTDGNENFYVVEQIDGVDLVSAAAHSSVELFGQGIPTFEARLLALLDLLEALQLVRGIGIRNEWIRANEVLLTRPFRFVLSEPGLARSINPIESSPADSVPGVRPIIELVQKIVFDPAWESIRPVEVLRSRRNSAARYQDPEIEARQDSFLDFHLLRELPGDGLVDEAVVRIRGQLERLKQERQQSLRGSTVHSGRLALPRRLSSSVIRTAGILTFGIGLALLVASDWIERRGVRRADALTLLQMQRSSTDSHEFARILRRSEGLLSEDERSIAQAALTDMVSAEADGKAIDAIHSLLRTGNPPEAEEQLPKGDTAAEELTAVMRSLQSITPELGRLFDLSESEHGLERWANLLRRRPELGTRTLRVVAIDLLNHRDWHLRWAAGAALASGALGRARSVDAAFEAVLRDPASDPNLCLTALGYFRGTETPLEQSLLDIALTPDASRIAFNPDQDQPIADLFLALCGSSRPLEDWTGLPPELATTAQIDLRIVAMIGLARLGSSELLAIARNLLFSVDSDLAKSSSACILTCAEALKPEEIEMLYEDARSIASPDARADVLEAVCKRRPDRGRPLWFRDISNPANGAEFRKELFARGIRLGFIRSRADLTSVLSTFAPGAVHDLSADLKSNPALRSIVASWADEKLDVQAAADRNLALLAGWLQISTDPVYFALRRLLLDAHSLGGEGSVYLEAITASHDLRAYQPLAELAHRRGLSADMRIVLGQAIHSYVGVLEHLAEAGQPGAEAAARQAERAADLIAREFLDSDDVRLIEFGAKNIRRGAAAEEWQRLSDFISADHPTALIAVAIDACQSMWFEMHGRPDDQQRLIADVGQRIAKLVSTGYEDTGLAAGLRFLMMARSDIACAAAVDQIALYTDTSVQEEALAYLELSASSQQLDDAIVALSQHSAAEKILALVIAMVDRHPTYASLDAIAHVFITTESPSIVLLAAKTLLDGGRALDETKLFDALKSTMIAATDPSSIMDDSLDSVSSRELLRVALDVGIRMPGPAFTEQFVDLLAHPSPFGLAELQYLAAILLIRMAEVNRTPEAVNEALAHCGIAPSALVELWGPHAANAKDAYTSFDLSLSVFHVPRFSSACDLLCRAFPKESSVFKLRARYRSEYGRNWTQAGFSLTSTTAADSASEDIDAIASDYQRAVGLGDPEAEQLRVELAQLYARASRARDAIRQLQFHLKVVPADTQSHLDLVRLQLQSGDPEGAFAEISSSGSSSPDDSVAEEFASALAEARLERGTDADMVAVEDLVRRVDVSPTGSEPAAALQAVISALFVSRSPAQESVRRAVVDRLDEILHNSTSRTLRQWAAFHMGSIGTVDECKRLLFGLGDIDEHVQRASIESLLSISTEFAFGELPELMRFDPKWRLMFVHRLAQLAPNRAGDLAHDWMSSGYLPNQLRALSWGVAFGTPGLLNAVVDLGVRPNHPGVKSLALRTAGILAARGEPVDLARIRTAMVDSPDPEVREAATFAMAMAGDRDVIAGAADSLRRARERGENARTLSRASVASAFLLALGPSESRHLLREFAAEIDSQRAVMHGEQLVIGGALGSRDEGLSDEEWGRQGDFFAGIGDLKKAYACYRKALDEDPLDTEWKRNVTAIELGTFVPPSVGYIRPGSEQFAGGVMVFQLDRACALADLADAQDSDVKDLGLAVSSESAYGQRRRTQINRKGVHTEYLEPSAEPVQRVSNLLYGRMTHAPLSDEQEIRTLNRLRSALEVMSRWSHYDIVAWNSLSRQLFEPMWNNQTWLYEGSPWIDLRSEASFGFSTITDAFGARVPENVSDAEALAAALPRICAIVSMLQPTSTTIPIRCGLAIAPIHEQRRFLADWIRGEMDRLRQHPSNSHGGR